MDQLPPSLEKWHEVVKAVEGSACGMTRKSLSLLGQVWWGIRENGDSKIVGIGDYVIWEHGLGGPRSSEDEWRCLCIHCGLQNPKKYWRIHICNIVLLVEGLMAVLALWQWRSSTESLCNADKHPQNKPDAYGKSLDLFCLEPKTLWSFLCCSALLACDWDITLSLQT